MQQGNRDPVALPRVRRPRAVQGLLIVATVLVGCLAAQATVRYQPQDASVVRDQTARWNFDTDEPGRAPSGLRILSGDWALRPDPRSPSPPQVLCQTGGALYPLALLTDAVYKDVVLSARVAPLSTRETQTVGLVFHFQDPENFYLIQADARIGTVNLYKNARSQLTKLAGGGAVGTPEQWQELRAQALEQPGAGYIIRAFLNGRQVFQTSDETFKAGKIGLTTGGISPACFDDVEARAL